LTFSARVDWLIAACVLGMMQQLGQNWASATASS
jgi:hypothetical protein